VSRWRCGNGECKRQTSTEQLPEIAALSHFEAGGSLNSFSYLATAPADDRENGYAPACCRPSSTVFEEDPPQRPIGKIERSKACAKLGCVECSG